MKRHHAKRHPGVQKLIDQLTHSSSELDAQAIDAMYGLEPVYEPGAAVSGGAMPTEFVSVSCPYCGENYETQIDLTGGSFSYIEDCQVCCQPIELNVVVGEAGELLSMVAQRAD